MVKSKTKVMLCLLTLIASAFITTINISTTFGDTYGPRLDTLYGQFIESPAAQLPLLTTAQVDVWPDIRDPVILRELEDDGFTVIQTQEAFLYYHIDINVRDQVGWGNGSIPLEGGTMCDAWRNSEDPDYFTYQGTVGTGSPYAGDGYAPLDNIYFRHALAHCIPKDEIVATVYGGISGAAIDSLIPAAQRAWYTPGVDGHPLALGDPLDEYEVWDGGSINHTACGILRAGGFVFDPEGPEPVDKYSPDDPDGNWIDPVTGQAMNVMIFAGVTEDIAPDSYGRDDMCYRNWRHIGLPISHPEVDYGYLTDSMMDYYQYDMYALGWSIGRFPNHLYDFFHSSMNRIPEGYNIPGVNNATLDGYLDIIQTSSDINEIKAAAKDASDLLAVLCVSIPTVTRPLNLAAGHEDATAFSDSVGGIINSPGFGADTGYTYTGLYWLGNVDPDTNPYGIGGEMAGIIPSEPTNYHPAFASTTDEYLILDCMVEGLIGVDVYTHQDIPWLATKWNVTDWDCTFEGAPAVGMNTTFWLRDDVYFHDGVKFDAYTCEYSLEWLKDMEIGRAQAMWKDLHDVTVYNSTCFSVFHNVSSLWTFYDIAGWAPAVPKHIYDGTTDKFRPEATAHRFSWMGEAVGVGDGSTTEFFLDNAPLAEAGQGEPERAVYVDGIKTNATYHPNTIDTSTGKITFTTAPPAAAVITADYLEVGVSDLTCLVSTGPYVLTDLLFELGGYAELSAYRTSVAPGPTQWWQSVEGYADWLKTCFHWIGDLTSDGVVDIYDLTKAGKSFGLEEDIGQIPPPPPGYDADADIDPEPEYQTRTHPGRVNMRDIIELSKAWGKQRTYA